MKLCHSVVALGSANCSRGMRRWENPSLWVQFKPAHPEDLDLLPLRSAGDLLCASVVDGDREDINKPAVSIRMGVIAFRRDNHDIGSCTEVDDI